jgi:hypothetical protein
MNWLKKIVVKWVREEWDSVHAAKQTGAYHGESYNVNQIKPLSMSDMSLYTNKSPNTNSINFQIYPANGGHVAEITFLDPNQFTIGGTNPSKSLHIIPSSEDLGEALSKIITYEMLKK